MKRPSPALVAHWYAKLRAAGFRDIEGGRDLNRLHASTFRGGDGTHGVAFEPMPAGFEPQGRLADHPTAVYYRALEHAASRLDRGTRLMVEATLAGNVRIASHRLSLTPQAVNKRLRALTSSMGLVHGS